LFLDLFILVLHLFALSALASALHMLVLLTDSVIEDA